MRRAIAIAILIGLPLSAARADVFRSVDAQGHVQYSDTPTPGAQLVRITSQHVPIQPSASPAAGSSPKASTVAQSGDQVHRQLEQEAAARAVQNDVAQTRADQCKRARDIYNQSVQARRLYKTAADGSREFLTDDEAVKQRLANKEEMDAACKGQ
ncbi:MAG: DUF4124 domain-containing protein [Steroidobacterales bacterium]